MWLSILWPLACAGLRLDYMTPCCDGTKDEDRDKSSDMFQEYDEASLVDELDECVLHLHEMSSEPTTTLTKTMHQKKDLTP
jgi:hypothetical protein